MISLLFWVTAYPSTICQAYIMWWSQCDNLKIHFNDGVKNNLETELLTLLSLVVPAFNDTAPLCSHHYMCVCGCICMYIMCNSNADMVVSNCILKCKQTNVDAASTATPDLPVLSLTPQIHNISDWYLAINSKVRFWMRYLIIYLFICPNLTKFKALE